MSDAPKRGRGWPPKRTAEETRLRKLQYDRERYYKLKTKPAAQSDEPAIEPAIEPTIGPAVKPAIGPAIGPAVKPAIEPTIGPAIEPAIKPIAVEPSS